MDEGDDYNAMLVLYGFFTEQSEKFCELRREVPAFHQPLRRFAEFYYIPKPSTRVRPPNLRYQHQALALFVLLRRFHENTTLYMLFGLPPSTLSRTLRQAEKVLSQALDGYKPARLSWPSFSHQTEHAKLVEARKPLLKYTFGFFDGNFFASSNRQMQISRTLCTTDGYIPSSSPGQFALHLRLYYLV
ncbi:hypothetical protein PHMEG_0004759 [Phytophthora megakarya]|uniref:Uncharacterized protein n=1 Tax=Phytophthora megakarya TaxID=4795 RepID=A0A225WT77_9STRA|nr:hypothetical protein PHMEG_0004759 [Phytophthora megakarya]